MHTLAHWQKLFQAKAATLYPNTDPSHDMLHIERVVHNALALAQPEQADVWVVMPAAYFHDMVNVPKNDPRRLQASTLSGEAAVAYLAEIGYPSQYYEAIKHAIAAHSFSAQIAPQTIEAKVVQDADRLDALGAIGMMRCFAVSGQLARPFYNASYPILPATRPMDDKQFALDHFYIKLFTLPALMNTKAAQQEAARRLEVMHTFIQALDRETALS